MGKGIRLIAGDVRCYAFAVIGFALFCVMLRQPYFGSILAATLNDAHGIRAVLDGLIISLAVIAVIVGIVASDKAWGSRLAIFGALLSAVGVGALGYAGAVDSSYISLAYAGAAFCATGFVMLCIAWVEQLAYVCSEALMTVAMASFTVSMVFGVADMLDGLAKLIWNMAVPLGSALCVLLCTRSTRDEALPETQLGTRIAVLAIAVLAIEVLCCSLMRGTWSSGGVGYAGVNAGRLTSYLVSAGFGLLFVAISLRARQVEKSAVIIGIISFACLVVLIVVVTVFGRRIAASFVTSLYSALLIPIFAVLVSAVRSRLCTGTLSGGVFAALFGFISLIAYSAIPRLSSYNPQAAAEIVLPTMLIVALLVVLGVSVVLALQIWFRVKALRGTPHAVASANLWDEVLFGVNVVKEVSFATEEEALDAAIEKASEQCRLTKREAEIVKLFAQGRTIKRTAEELCLAPSTVQSYTKSIYAKLGVRGKDEIKDLLASYL